MKYSAVYIIIMIHVEDKKKCTNRFWLSYYDAFVQDVSYYVTGTTPPCFTYGS